MMNFKRKQCLIFLICCTAFLKTITFAKRLPPEPVYTDFKNPPQGVFLDEWMEIYISGHKAGYQNTYFIRRGDEIHSHSETYYKIGRNTDTVEIRVEQNTVETVEGRPLQVKNKTHLGRQPIRVEGVAEGDMMRIKMIQGDQISEDLYSLGEDALMTWGMKRKSVMEDYEPGTEYSLSLYSPDLSANTAVTAAVKVMDKEHIDYFGTRLELQSVEMTMHVQQYKYTIEMWIDESGQAVKMLMNAAGAPMEFYLTDKESALSEFSGKEIFNETLLPVSRSIPDDAQAVTYQMRRKDGKQIDFKPLKSNTQTFEQELGGSLIINVKQADHDDFRDQIGLRGLSNAEDYLQSNIMINKDDFALRQLHADALGNRNYKLKKKVDKLRKFVSSYIKVRNLGVGFATASEVCRKPEGDCTEFAILLAALGRISDIPTRVVAGLVYIEEFAGRENIMGYHMWTQFYIDGTWVDLDAMFNETECSPKRIALAATSLKDASLADIGFSLWDIIGAVDVDIIEVDIPSLF